MGKGKCQWCIGKFRTIGNFANEQIISDHKGILHGGSGNSVGLDEQGPDENNKNQCNQDGTDPINKFS